MFLSIAYNTSHIQHTFPPIIATSKTFLLPSCLNISQTTRKQVESVCFRLRTMGTVQRPPLLSHGYITTAVLQIWLFSPTGAPLCCQPNCKEAGRGCLFQIKNNGNAQTAELVNKWYAIPALFQMWHSHPWGHHMFAAKLLSIK